MRYAAALRAALLVLLFTSTSLTTHAQRWNWPATPENLQVLPANTDADQLQQTMLLFVRSLGVRCSHCHVGEEGQPLGTYDFASDAKPAKAKARVMMEMVRTINEGHLASLTDLGVAPSDLLRVTCGTCHRGLARPEALEDVLAASLDADGIEALRTTYTDLRARYYGASAYNFSEATLHALGRQLLGTNRTADAIAVLQMNAEFFPASSQAAASLAEAYLVADMPQQARVFFEHALRLDPTNASVVTRLERLQP